MLWQKILTLFASERQRRAPVSVGTIIKGTRVMLRAPSLHDAQNWINLRSLSADFLIPFEPAWPKGSLSVDFYDAQWRRLQRRWVQDREYAFLIFQKSSDNSNINCGGALLGGITINDVRRGVYQSATLGYWMGLPYAGQGFMKEAAMLATRFAFDQLHLHRLDASCLPDNAPSLSVLRSIGMREIGLSRDYMQINYVWRDHLLLEKLRG
jgi:ribosomal-protein-alanine N-acetyltransferase